jgi:hypothetical protein
MKTQKLIFILFLLSLFIPSDCSYIYIESTKEKFQVKTFKYLKSPSSNNINTFLLPSLANTTGVDVCDAKFEAPKGLNFKNKAIFVTSLGTCNVEMVKFFLF